MKGVMLAAALPAASCLLGLVSEPSRAQSWASQSVCTVGTLEMVWFTNPLDGWSVGDHGLLLRTTNGGEIWNPVSLTSENLEDVAFRDGSVGLVVGHNNLILRTTNGGDSWTRVTVDAYGNLGAVAFGSAGVVYAATLEGVILRSTDDGVTWGPVDFGTLSLSDSTALGQAAWVVGENGLIRATTNGGTTWATRVSGTMNDLRGVFFLTPSEGWIAGESGTLLQTVDGGLTWEPRNTGTGVGLNAVHFVTSYDGFVVGEQGVILRTADGGLTWVVENGNTADELRGVYFADAGHGWSVGIVCTILFRESMVHAGRVPPTLTMTKVTAGGETITLSWSASCSAAASDYGIHEGMLGNWYSHTRIDCADDGGDRTEQVSTSPGNAYYLLVPHNAADEGSYGTGSSGIERPGGTTMCRPSQWIGPCP